MTCLLFVCSGNRDRSPTAEQVFSSRPDVSVDSGGTRPDADLRVSTEQVKWADIIFVMEGRHRTALKRSFPQEMKDKKVIYLDIPDNFAFMATDLVAVLKHKVERHLVA